MLHSQNRDTLTCPVMDNHVSDGLASQALAEYGQDDDETFRAALQNGLLTKIVMPKHIRLWAIMTPMALHHKR